MNPWIRDLQEAILSNSALRDGLTDDEAQPLIDWGLGLAEQLGNQLAAMPADEAESLFEEKQSALLKLLTRISWVAIYQQEKGPSWTEQTLQQLNDFNRAIQGGQAPQLKPEMLTHSAASAAAAPKSRGSVVQQLMQGLSAESAVQDGTATASASADSSASAPPDAFEGARQVFQPDATGTATAAPASTGGLGAAQEDHTAPAAPTEGEETPAPDQTKGLFRRAADLVQRHSRQQETPPADSPPAIDAQQLRQTYQASPTSPEDAVVPPASPSTPSDTNTEETDNGETQQ